MYHAVIFDMNGVIINDERVHQESWRQLCQKYGFSLTEEEFRTRVFGRTEKETLEFLFKKTLSEEEVAKYSAERVAVAIEIYRPQIALADGLREFLEELAQRGIPLGIATSSRRVYKDFILDTLDIRRFFQTVVTAEDISHGKPDPEVFLKAAAQLGVEPTSCVAFEDSVSGVKSAKAAGMYVVAITTTHPKEELGLADKVVGSFREVGVENLSVSN